MASASTKQQAKIIFTITVKFSDLPPDETQRAKKLDELQGILKNNLKIDFYVIGAVDTLEAKVVKVTNIHSFLQYFDFLIGDLKRISEGYIADVIIDFDEMRIELLP